MSSNVSVVDCEVIISLISSEPPKHFVSVLMASIHSVFKSVTPSQSRVLFDNKVGEEEEVTVASVVAEDFRDEGDHAAGVLDSAPDDDVIDELKQNPVDDVEALLDNISTHSVACGVNSPSLFI